MFLRFIFAYVVFPVMLVSGTATFGQEITHSFLGVGKANQAIIVGEDGEVKWKYDLPCSDGWVLPNGNVLLAVYPNKRHPGGGVVEVDRDTKKILFEFQGTQKEVSSVQAIGNGKYLVAELGPAPRAIVINRQGEILKETPFACQIENTHMQTRMLRLLPNGNYIGPHLLDFAVKEYDPDTGRVVRSVTTDERGREKRDWPFSALRLPNGNSLISCTNGNRVIEVDEDGAIVWKVDNEDFKEQLIRDACGAQRLANGNTVVTSYQAKKGQVKLLEITPDKKVVWRFSGFDAGFHHFQILTTNGDALINDAVK